MTLKKMQDRTSEPAGAAADCQKEPKDAWDKLLVLSIVAIAVVLGWFGYIFQSAQDEILKSQIEMTDAYTSAMAQMEKQRYMASFFDALANPDPDIRELAISTIGEVASGDATIELLGIMARHDKVVEVSQFAQVQLLNRNLIKNPSAEASESGKPSFWTVSAKYTVRRRQPAPNSGKNYFYPAQRSADKVAIAYQIIDMAGLEKLIDSGQLTGSLSGYMRDYDGHDTSQIILELLDENDKRQSEPCISRLYKNKDEWEYYSSQIKIPPHTKKAKISLKSIRNEGSNNDGYFDDLSFILQRTQAGGQGRISNRKEHALLLEKPIG